MEPVNPVPRGQALTPDQIAAYVQKQRLLVAQTKADTQTSIQQPQPSVMPQPVQRPISINVPPRGRIQ